MSNTTARRPGDYTGNPIARAVGILAWVDSARTQLEVLWVPAPGVDPNATDHLLLYVNGVQDANRANRRAQIITVPTPGVLPYVCAIYVPEQVDYDNAYDPIGGDPTANNCLLKDEVIAIYAVELDENALVEALDENALVEALDENALVEALDENALVEVLT